MLISLILIGIAPFVWLQTNSVESFCVFCATGILVWILVRINLLFK